MFTYSSLSIDSATPIQEVYAYFAEIGALRGKNNYFTYQDLQIEVAPSSISCAKSLNIEMHEITVTNGERALAEKFLTDFRFRFLSAGG